jgi:hypothetical protein
MVLAQYLRKQEQASGFKHRRGFNHLGAIA